MSNQQHTRVCSSHQFETEWARLIDELSRRGVLAAVGAADALLRVAGDTAGSPASAGQPERGAP